MHEDLVRDVMRESSGSAPRAGGERQPATRASYSQSCCVGRAGAGRSGGTYGAGAAGRPSGGTWRAWAAATGTAAAAAPGRPAHEEPGKAWAAAGAGWLVLALRIAGAELGESGAGGLMAAALVAGWALRQSGAGTGPARLPGRR